MCVAHEVRVAHEVPEKEAGCGHGGVGTRSRVPAGLYVTMSGWIILLVDGPPFHHILVIAALALVLAALRARIAIRRTLPI